MRLRWVRIGSLQDPPSGLYVSQAFLGLERFAHLTARALTSDTTVTLLFPKARQSCASDL